MSLGFYLDPAGTTRAASAVVFDQANVDAAPADRIVYFGSPIAGRLARGATGGNIVVSISGAAAAVVALATTSTGLATATPGAALDLGTELPGWPLTPIHIRVHDTGGVIGQTQFTLTTGEIEEWRL
jgi:hypothetical protein